MTHNEKIKAVKDKLSAELKEAQAVNQYAKVIARPCMEALVSFCQQDAEFAEAVLLGDFIACMKKVTENMGRAVSDIEVYRRAVDFYFPGAKVDFVMEIRVNPYDAPAVLGAREETKEAREVETVVPTEVKAGGGFIKLSLEDLF